MSLARLAVRHPVTTVMLMLAVLLLGAVSLGQIPVDLLPNVEYPVIVVTARYPGAAPEEVERLVTRRLEEAVARMAGLDRMSSSSREGLAVVQARFTWGKGLDQAALDMREKVDMVKRYLPADVEDVIVTKADPNMRPILRLDLYGDKDKALITDIGRDVIKPALERIDGIASVDVVGGIDRKVFVDLDPKRLQSYGLTVAHVTSALRQENITLPGGDVAVGDRRVKVRTLGDFKSLDDIEDLRLTSPLGATVTLREVATVTAGPDEVTSLARYNGKPSVSLNVTKQSGTNTVQVVRAVERAMPRILSALPEGVHLVISEDQSRFINDSINTASSNAIQGGILAGIVLFLFLWDWRSTAVISLSMPMSIVTTFVCMYFSKMSLNMMSLGGVALGVGMLVDNSIVVLENIYRHHSDLGKSPVEAAIDGAEEVSMAITASTLTNLVVFVPILFTNDFSSHLFRELALVVTYSIGSSLLVALSLVPVGCAWLLQLPKNVKYERGFLGSITRSLENLPNAYRATLVPFLGRPRNAYAVLTACLMITGAVMPLIGREFLPRMDRREIIVSVSMEKGTRLATTDTVVRSIEQIVASLPEADTYSSIAGGSMSAFGASSGSSENGSINLKLKNGRDKGRSTDAVRDEIRRVASDFPGARIRVETVSGVAGEQDFMGSAVEVTLRGEDYGVLQEIAREVAVRLQRLSFIKDVDTGVEDSLPELHVKVDRRKASFSGMSAGQVATLVKAAIQGETATRYRLAGSEYDVLVRLANQFRESIPDVESLLLPGSGGQLTPLWQIASVTREMGPIAIQRQNQARTVIVRAQHAGKDLGSVQEEVRKDLSQMSLPDGYTIQYTGQSQEMMGAFSSLGFVLVLAIILDYMILASQFESLVHPVTVMMTVPLAAIGSILGLFLTGQTFAVPSLIGLITLAGVVVNNAIVFVDSINQMRKRGMTVREAVVETGTTRLRPVLMTSLTTIMGLLPLSLGLGSGSELQAPLAVVIMGGLLTSTFLTLYIVPAMYELIDRALNAVKKRFGGTHKMAAKTVSTSLLVLVLAAVSLFGYPGMAIAQSYTFTPQEAVSRALANHPSLRAADARIAALQIQKLRVDANALQIQASPTMPYDDPKTRQDAKTKYYTPKQVASALEIAQRYRAALEQNLRLGTLMAYYNTVKYRELHGGALDLQLALNEQVEVARLSKRAGLAIDRDIYQAEARRAEAMAGRYAYESAVRQANLALNKVVGLDPDDTVYVERPIYNSVSFDLAERLLEASNLRYEIFKAQKDLELAQYDLLLAQTYAAGSPMGYIEYAQVVVSEMQAMLEHYTREVSFGVRSAHAGLTAAEVKYGARNESANAASESLRVTRLRREQGLATDADVRLAEGLLAQADAAVREAMCDLEIARSRFLHLCSNGSSSDSAGSSGQ